MLSLHARLFQALQRAQVVAVSSPTWWLKAEDVVPPPRATTPPKGTGPDISVLTHVLKHTLHSSPALGVGAARVLAEHTELLVGLEPGSRAADALRTDGGRDALVRGAGAVAVEVLVHFVDDLVLWVLEVLEVVVGDVPGPGAGVGVAFDEDGLAGGASGTNAVDGCLVHVENIGLVCVIVSDLGVSAHGEMDADPRRGIRCWCQRWR